MNIEIGTTLTIDDEILTIASIKGRRVKLSDGRNISRQDASDAADEYLEMQIEAADDEPELDDEESEGNTGTMSGTLSKYRAGYVKAISYTKGVTLDNGDLLAEALRGMSPADVCWIADMVHNQIPGTHFAKYEHLNIGSRRMNAGNRIRGAIRKELITLAEVMALTGRVAGRSE